MRFPVVLLLLPAAVAAVPARPVAGCAVALRPDVPGSAVEVATETALIVWDEKTKTEHFIRAASFASTSADFGFLVPTPTPPTVEEADPSIFRTLTSTTAPRTQTIVKTVRPELSCGSLKTVSFSAGAATARPDGVEVLEKKKVGDYDVAVLKADDPGLLRAWLEKNGYDARPQLADWLKVYVANKWVLTAFKISTDRAVKPAAGPPSTGKSKPAGAVPSAANAHPLPVRMSFQTDRPFYPYREPADQRLVSPDAAPPSRFLRVFFLADARFAGTLGDKGDWPGKTAWANAIDAATFAAVSKGASLPADLAGRPWFLTEFEDTSAPRPGTDEVYFAKAADQATVERPPVTVYEYRESPPAGAVMGVLAAVPVVLLIAGLLVRRKWKRTPASDPASGGA
jgi:hypothetical protein